MRWHVLIPAVLTLAAGARAAPEYAVVCPRTLLEDPGWTSVVRALERRHDAAVIAYDGKPGERRAELAALRPRFTCFVARPDQVTREFVAGVHRLAAEYDEDPYLDTQWGILTGYDASNALAIARESRPLEIRRVAGGTDFALDMVEEGRWYCELRKNHGMVKAPGGEPRAVTVPDDTTALLAGALNDGKTDLFSTSGHATERDWQIGYRYKNGQFQSRAGRLYGLDTADREIDIASPNPKVYLPIGNCLMGHIDGADAMALAWMKSAGVRQMIGYTVPTWFGYAGWGMLDYFVEQPGRYTMAEAFYANTQALIHRLQTDPPDHGDRRGLAFDRDKVAFYGDPAWEARLRPRELPFDQTLVRKGEVYTFRVTPRRGETSYAPVNVNGSQRGGRPFVAILPQRIGAAEVMDGAAWKPVIADDFVLVPRPAAGAPEIQVVFRAAPAR
jgi:zinc protease